MKTKQMWIIGILAALLLVPMALAQDGRPGPRGGRMNRPPMPPQEGQYDEFAPGPMGGQQRPGPGPGLQQMRRPQGGILGVDVNQHVRMISRVAELTPEQQEAVKAILEKSRPVALENQKALQDAMKALREAVLEGETDKVTACSEALSKAITKQATHSAETIKAVKAELTPEQLEKLKTFRTEMQERIQQRRQQQFEGDQAGPDDELPPPPAQQQDRPRPRRNAQW